MKNSNGLAISWNEQKAALKKKLSIPIDGNSSSAAENREQTLSKLEVKLGKTRTELVAIIASIEEYVLPGSPPQCATSATNKNQI